MKAEQNCSNLTKLDKISGSWLFSSPVACFESRQNNFRRKNAFKNKKKFCFGPFYCSSRAFSVISVEWVGSKLIIQLIYDRRKSQANDVSLKWDRVIQGHGFYSWKERQEESQGGKSRRSFIFSLMENYWRTNVMSMCFMRAYEWLVRSGKSSSSSMWIQFQGWQWAIL